VVAAVDFESFLPEPVPLLSPDPPESFFDDESLEGVSDFEGVDAEESLVLPLPLPAESPPDESLEEFFPFPFEPLRESFL
jgi:hypothetical protein